MLEILLSGVSTRLTPQGLREQRQMAVALDKVQRARLPRRPGGVGAEVAAPAYEALKEGDRYRWA